MATKQVKGKSSTFNPSQFQNPLTNPHQYWHGVIVMDSIRHMLPSMVSAPNMRLYVEHSNYYTSLICRKRQQTQKQQN